MTLFILEYQAYNSGKCDATNPLGYTDETAAVVSSCDTHTVMIVNSEGEVWRGYKQVLRHGHEVE